MRRMHAFTLVELLVVIGIIALLISILMPSLQKARESAQRVQCLSNIRQVTVGLIMYTNENQQYFPPIRDTGYDYGGWIFQMARYVGANPQPDPTKPASLSNIPPSSPLYCPVEALGYNSNPHKRWFYSINHDLRFERKITQIKQPASAMVFIENGMYEDVIHPPFLEYAFWGHPAGGYVAGPAHAGKGISIAYLDGHADFWTGKVQRGTYTTDSGLPWTHSTFWGWPHKAAPPTQYLATRNAKYRP